MVPNGLNFLIVLRECAISGTNTAVGENGAQSSERLVYAILPIIEIRDKSAKGIALSVRVYRHQQSIDLQVMW